MDIRSSEQTTSATWPVSKGSLTEMEADEPDLSDVTTVEERFAMMWQLAQDAWAFRGEPIDESPFLGPAIRIDRRRN
jgi:hypothetical protein